MSGTQGWLSDPTLSVWDLTADGDPIQTVVGNPNNICNAFETSLDVEWAHAAAPGATIDLVQTGPYVRDILDGMAWAADALPVSVVTTSFGYNGPESQALEQTYDHDFAQPANGQHVAFVAAAGDYGSGDTDYPALSPQQIQSAYGFDPSVSGKSPGTGQAIAIMVCGIDPTIRQDLHAFDVQSGLSDPT
ncbi:MAG: hypothetical protein JO329_24095, partial [Planctomycetaceae bacterium]|nr:hypothetical protein [Planctomycetaceae bacterium]